MSEISVGLKMNRASFRRLLFFLLLLSLPLTDAIGGEKVTVTPPRSYRVQKVLLFPLEVPATLIRGAAYPLLVSGRFIEKCHVVERTLDLLSNEERTRWIYPILETGGGSGFGGGFGIKHSDLFHRGYHLGTNVLIFSDLDRQVGLSLGNPKAAFLSDRPFAYKFSASWQRESDDDFFGTGNSSQKVNFSEFLSDEVTGGISLSQELARHLKLSQQTLFRTARSGPSPSGTVPSVETSFAASDLPGFGRRLSYADLEVRLSHDTRDSQSAPEAGGVRSISFHRLQGLQSGFDFNQYDLDLRQFFPLWRPRRVLALRNHWIFQQETGSGQIPFYRLAALDINAPLRGFDRGRFRDRGIAVFNLEYRYPVWDLIDGTIFIDTGRLFDDPSDYSFRQFKYSVGGGVQFTTRHFFLFRLQAAYGGEGVNLVFAATKAL